jgi:hypothetical protein
MSRKSTTKRRLGAPDVVGRPVRRPGETTPTRQAHPARDPVTRPTPPAEDFATRPDLESADEPAGEHDRRYHNDARPA